MRRLIYVPIVHAMVDAGSQADALRQEYIARFGLEEWVRSRELIDQLWDGIRRRLLDLDVPWKQVRVYQDGLPVCRRELGIAREVAAMGSPNYRLVLELVNRGATLMGTEDPELLAREYACIKRAAGTASDAEATGGDQRCRVESAELLRERDTFIARRIAATLQESEVGILFIGMMHEVDQLLPDGIHVEFLIDRLPLREVEERR